MDAQRGNFTSARVGVGYSIMDCSRCDATMTGLPICRHRTTISFCTEGTSSKGICAPADSVTEFVHWPWLIMAGLQKIIQASQEVHDEMHHMSNVPGEILVTPVPDMPTCQTASRSENTLGLNAKTHLHSQLHCWRPVMLCNMPPTLPLSQTSRSHAAISPCRHDLHSTLRWSCAAALPSEEPCESVQQLCCPKLDEGPSKATL